MTQATLALSDHARVRLQQHGVRPHELETVWLHGQPYHIPLPSKCKRDGAEARWARRMAYWFNENSLDSVENPQAAEHLRNTALIVATDGTVVTVLRTSAPPKWWKRVEN